MEYKDLLIHLDHSKGCVNRLETALELARRYDARLLGLFVVQDYAVPSYVEAQLSATLITEATEREVTRARETLDTYRRMADDAGVNMEASVTEGQLIPILREHTKYADLLVLGQDHPDDPENASAALADELLFECACPFMVVPHSGKLAAPGKRVLLTWNASRESAHALRAALPVLAAADTVAVLSSEPDDADADVARGYSHARELTRYLASHGINPVSERISDPELSASEAIIGHAADMNADLIVMGAYGHTRLREIILGGVTRDLLKRAPVPLFLTH